MEGTMSRDADARLPKLLGWTVPLSERCSPIAR
jgi:hypothetical protein